MSAYVLNLARRAAGIAPVIPLRPAMTPLPWVADQPGPAPDAPGPRPPVATADPGSTVLRKAAGPAPPPAAPRVPAPAPVAPTPAEGAPPPTVVLRPAPPLEPVVERLRASIPQGFSRRDPSGKSSTSA